MRLTLGLLADAANTTPDNKINILGEFNVVNARQFPAGVPSICLVFRLEADGAEADHHLFHIRLMDEDGNLVRPIGDGEFNLGPPRGGGAPRRVQAVLPIQLATFDKPGTYTFEILVDNERPDSIAPIEVTVVQVQQP